MTSTDLAIRDRPEIVRLDTNQLTYIATTEFVPKGLRGNVPAILACVATGRELGIGDMAALRHIHLIDGSPTYSAQLMTSLVRKNKHSIRVVSRDENHVTVRGERADTGDDGEVTWTLERAKTAGLLNKRNWQQYPEGMLWARAVSQLCRELFSDICMGSYTAEELGEAHTDEEGGLPAETPPPDPAEDVPFGDVAPPLGPEIAAAKESPPATAPQKKKLNVLVGKLREQAGRITTENLWKAVAILRSVETDALMLELGAFDDDGVPHWSPLREALTKAEANSLIDRLERLDAEPPPDAGADQTAFPIPDAVREQLEAEGQSA
jgi:hypothetical protein